MTESHKLEILNSIKKGGFISELKVSKSFNSKEWLTLNNYIYYDRDKNVNREIDLLCIKGSQHNSFSKLNISIHISVEVKKSEKGWVFFVSKNEPTTLEHGYFSLLTFKNINYDILNDFFKKHPRQQSQFVSTSYCEPFREKTYDDNSNAISNIYRGIESAVKATYYFRNTNELERNKPKKSDEEEENEIFLPLEKKFASKINLFIPLIVLDGTLIRGELDENADLQIEECDYIPYESYYIDNAGIENMYAVDIVQIDNLNKYLADLEKWLDEKALEILKVRGD